MRPDTVGVTRCCKPSSRFVRHIQPPRIWPSLGSLGAKEVRPRYLISSSQVGAVVCHQRRPEDENREQRSMHVGGSGAMMGTGASPRATRPDGSAGIEGIFSCHVVPMPRGLPSGWHPPGGLSNPQHPWRGCWPCHHRLGLLQAVWWEGMGQWPWGMGDNR